MSDYKRLTEKGSEYFTVEDTTDDTIVLLHSDNTEEPLDHFDNDKICQKLNLLVSLEDMLENGEFGYIKTLQVENERLKKEIAYWKDEVKTARAKAEATKQKLQAETRELEKALDEIYHLTTERDHYKHRLQDVEEVLHNLERVFNKEKQ